MELSRPAILVIDMRRFLFTRRRIRPAQVSPSSGPQRNPFISERADSGAEVGRQIVYLKMEHQPI